MVRARARIGEAGGVFDCSVDCGDLATIRS